MWSANQHLTQSPGMARSFYLPTPPKVQNASLSNRGSSMMKHFLVGWLVLSGLARAADTEKPVLALESGGHHGSVNSGSVFFSRDGKELISTAGGSDTSVR